MVNPPGGSFRGRNLPALPNRRGFAHRGAPGRARSSTSTVAPSHDQTRPYGMPHDEKNVRSAPHARMKGLQTQRRPHVQAQKVPCGALRRVRARPALQGAGGAAAAPRPPCHGAGHRRRHSQPRRGLRALARRAARGRGRLRVGNLGHGAVLLLAPRLRVWNRHARRPLPPRARALARGRGAHRARESRDPHHQRLPAGAGRPQHVLQAHPALPLRHLWHGRGRVSGGRRGGCGAPGGGARLGRHRHGLHARDHRALPPDPARARRGPAPGGGEPRGRARAAGLPPRGLRARHLCPGGRRRARAAGHHRRHLRPREPAHVRRHQLRPHRPPVGGRRSGERRAPHAGPARRPRELREPGARGAPQAHEPHHAALQGLGLRPARKRGLRDRPVHD